MAFEPTAEQRAIVQAARESAASLMITAFAGCAKTTTLELIANSITPRPALALAFNVKIKKELEKRFPAWFKVMTMNGLGHGAWQRAIGKRCEVDEKKLGKCVTEVTREAGFNASPDQWASIREITSAAMLAGIVPRKYPHKGLMLDTDENWLALAEDCGAPDPVLIGLAKECLTHSVGLSFKGVISFDDQIYMAALFGGQFQRFDLVMVDESQDLSPLNHIQVKRSALDRLIVVGDPKQAIYQFRGADSESMAKLRALRTEWIDLPLATTFRCPKSIVERQQSHAFGFTAWSTNPEGTFEKFPLPISPDAPWRTPDEMPDGDDVDLNTWTFRQLDVRSHGGSIAVLCRNNAPLVSMAFRLIRQNVGCTMLGRDIGRGLQAIAKKLIPDDAMLAPECMRTVAAWRDREMALARANEDDRKCERIDDQSACLIAVLETSGAKNAKELRSAIDSLFARDNARVVLATGHRAKGLEWDLVVHLDPWRIPSKFAQSPAAKEQESNLRYVIETRTKHTLIEADLEDFAS